MLTFAQPEVTSVTLPDPDPDPAPAPATTWTTVSKKGTVREHSRESMSGLLLAPAKVRLSAAQASALSAAQAGNYSGLRDSLICFTGKVAREISAQVVDDLSIIDAQGTRMVPVCDPLTPRTKTVALAVANAIAALTGLKGAKLTAQKLCVAFVACPMAK